MLFRNVLIFVMLPFVLCEADSGQRFFRTHFAPLLSQHYSEYFIQYLMNYEVFLLWLVRTQTITGLMKMPKIVLFVPFGCLPHPWVWSSLHTQIQWSILSWKLEETLFKSLESLYLWLSSVWHSALWTQSTLALLDFCLFNTRKFRFHLDSSCMCCILEQSLDSNLGKP